MKVTIPYGTDSVSFNVPDENFCELLEPYHPEFSFDEDKIIEFAKDLDIDYVNSRLIVNGEDVEDSLHMDIVDAHVAQLSAIVKLRHIVNEKIRKITEIF